MNAEKPVEIEKACECDCDCDCDCECCRSGKCQKKTTQQQASNNPFSHISLNDTVGAIFLGILAVMLLVFLVRSNKRNRELLLEVINLRRQA
jgi:hypothetical protein